VGSYFKPLRRKIGVVTLVMACVFAAGWVRSQGHFDVVCIRWRAECCSIESIGGLFEFRYLTIGDEGTLDWDYFRWDSQDFWIPYQDGKPCDYSPFYKGHEVEWQRSWVGFNLGVARYGAERYEIFTIPYWSVVIPMTLLSAWLLLSKPRKKPVAVSPAQSSATASLETPPSV
jgi:hypothetical protein